MKNKKTILITIFASLFAVLTVVNMSMASPKSAGENTLDMLEVMTRAFDESEGGESSEPRYAEPEQFNCTVETYANAQGKVFAFGKLWPIGAQAGGYVYVSTNMGVNCHTPGTYHCTVVNCIEALKAWFGVEPEEEPS